MSVLKSHRPTRAFVASCFSRTARRRARWSASTELGQTQRVAGNSLAATELSASSCTNGTRRSSRTLTERRSRRTLCSRASSLRASPCAAQNFTGRLACKTRAGRRPWSSQCRRRRASRQSASTTVTLLRLTPSRRERAAALAERN